MRFMKEVEAGEYAIVEQGLGTMFAEGGKLTPGNLTVSVHDETRAKTQGERGKDKSRFAL